MSIPLPECLFAAKERLSNPSEFVSTESLNVSDPRVTYKKYFDKGQLTAADFPNNQIRAGSAFRRETYANCSFVRNAPPSDLDEVIYGGDCVVRRLTYRCEIGVRVVWLHPVVEVEFYRLPSEEKSFQVKKAVLLCASGGARVLAGTSPAPAPKAFGNYDAAADALAGQDCPGCDCADPSKEEAVFVPPETLAISEGFTTGQPPPPAGTTKVQYWRLVPPRRRVAPCVEKNTYRLAEREVTINTDTGVVSLGDEKLIDPAVTHEFVFQVPGCIPPVGRRQEGPGRD